MLKQPVKQANKFLREIIVLKIDSRSTNQSNTLKQSNGQKYQHEITTDLKKIYILHEVIKLCAQLLENMEQLSKTFNKFVIAQAVQQQMRKFTRC